MIAKACPRVAVVMAVYNGERYLGLAIDSILQQSFRDFEFIIVDDASTDRTAEILEETRTSDPRVRLLRNEINLGPYPSGNRGLDMTSAPIIARMDADDISTPDRLAQQVAFLDANSDHLLVGSGYRAIDHEGNPIYTKTNPMDAFAVRWLTRFRTPMPHPAICFRAAFPNGTPIRYDESLPVAQDFELMARLARDGQAASLAPALIDYRMHSTNISTTKKEAQQANVRKIAGRALAHDLPPYLACRLEKFLDVYLLGHAATSSIVAESVAAFDDMLALDIAAEPLRRPWLMRQTAGLLAEAFLRRGGGLHNPTVLSAFAIYGRRYLPALVGRVLENTGRLPPRWQSYPEPAGAGA